jgi:hypothetical protein
MRGRYPVGVQLGGDAPKRLAGCALRSDARDDLRRHKRRTARRGRLGGRPRRSSSLLRRNRPLGYFVVACIGVALPGIDPVTTILETIPLMILFEASIWASVVCERRWQRMPSTVAGTLT